MLPKPFRLFLLLVLLLALAGMRTDAATVSMHESFYAFDSALWDVSYNGSTAPSPTSNAFGIVTISGTNYLNLQRNSNGTANAFVYWMGTPEFAPNGKLSDFEMDVVVRLGAAGAGTSNTFGFAFRTADTTYAHTGNPVAGYYLSINVNQGTLTLWESPQNHTALGTSLQSTSISGFSANVDYTLKLKAEGSRIEASLWAPGGTEAIASLLITDAKFTDAGYFGLRTGFGNQSPSVFYRDLNVAAIPEPSQVAVAAFMVGILLFRRKSVA